MDKKLSVVLQDGDVLRVEPNDEISLQVAVDKKGVGVSVVLTPRDAAVLVDWLIAWLNEEPTDGLVEGEAR